MPWRNIAKYIVYQFTPLQDLIDNSNTIRNAYTNAYVRRINMPGRIKHLRVIVISILVGVLLVGIAAVAFIVYTQKHQLDFRSKVWIEPKDDTGFLVSFLAREDMGNVLGMPVFEEHYRSYVLFSNQHKEIQDIVSNDDAVQFTKDISERYNVSYTELLEKTNGPIQYCYKYEDCSIGLTVSKSNNDLCLVALVYFDDNGLSVYTKELESEYARIDQPIRIKDVFYLNKHVAFQLSEKRFEEKNLAAYVFVSEEAQDKIIGAVCDCLNANNREAQREAYSVTYSLKDKNRIYCMLKSDDNRLICVAYDEDSAVIRAMYEVSCNGELIYPYRLVYEKNGTFYDIIIESDYQ